MHVICCCHSKNALKFEKSQEKRLFKLNKRLDFFENTLLILFYCEQDKYFLK